MKFRARIENARKTATGIEVPAKIVEGLGSKRPKVKVTLKGYTYRSSVASMGGRFMLGVSAEVREKAGVAGGDTVDVELELDTEIREVKVPADLAAALKKAPAAKKFFEGLSYSNRLRLVLAIDAAKTDETRQRRISKTIEALAAGRK